MRTISYGVLKVSKFNKMTNGDEERKYAVYKVNEAGFDTFYIKKIYHIIHEIVDGVDIGGERIPDKYFNIDVNSTVDKIIDSINDGFNWEKIEWESPLTVIS